MTATICTNKKAIFDYFLTDKYEAGIALQGWEVKSLRACKCQLRDTYVVIINHEAWLLNSQVTPLISVSRQTAPEPMRSRKLLLHRKEIDKISGLIQQQGVTCLAIKMYWKGCKVKCEIRIATGKKKHDKRQLIKDREWSREKNRILKHDNR